MGNGNQVSGSSSPPQAQQVEHGVLGGPQDKQRALLPFVSQAISTLVSGLASTSLRDGLSFKAIVGLKSTIGGSGNGMGSLESLSNSIFSQTGNLRARKTLGEAQSKFRLPLSKSTELVGHRQGKPLTKSTGPVPALSARVSMDSEASFHPNIETVNLKESSFRKWLPIKVRAKTNLVSVLPLEQRQRIGLFRAPKVDESSIKNFAYNLAFAHESLRLGKHMQSLFAQGKCPEFESLWDACRTWRVKQLNAKTSEDEVMSFSLDRRDFSGGEATTIHLNDIRYGHLIQVLTDKAKAKLNEPDVRIDLSSEVFEDVSVQRISLQASVVLNEQEVFLTELRTVVRPDGQPVLHPWVTPENEESAFIGDAVKKELAVGNMWHVSPYHLELFSDELQNKLQAFGDLVRSGQSATNNSSTHVDFSDPHTHQVLSSLGEMHYLLAHAMFDKRGSAAKSELMIRALAVSAGLELPPFKQGFVPDLEAFVSSNSVFVKNYADAFEH